MYIFAQYSLNFFCPQNSPSDDTYDCILLHFYSFNAPTLILGKGRIFSTKNSCFVLQILPWKRPIFSSCHIILTSTHKFLGQLCDLLCLSKKIQTRIDGWSILLPQHRIPPASNSPRICLQFTRAFFFQKIWREFFYVNWPFLNLFDHFWP